MRTNETDPVTSDESDRKRPNMSNMEELSKSIAGGHSTPKKRKRTRTDGMLY